MNPLAKAAALGAATGARSSYGIAAVAISSAPGTGGPLGLLTSPRGKKAVSVMAALETLGDKLPMTPSRLKPSGLIFRLGNGAGAAALTARRDGLDMSAAARTGVVAAAAATVLGAAWRRFGSRGDRADLPAALIEDVVAAALAAWGARPTAPALVQPEPPVTKPVKTA
jgi:uncharacterized membrane protein